MSDNKKNETSGSDDSNEESNDESIVTTEIFLEEQNEINSGNIKNSAEPKKISSKDLRKAASAENDDSDSNGNEDIFFSNKNDNETDPTDALGPAYDLEDGSLIESSKEEERAKVSTKVTSIQDFFDTEIYSRYDQLDKSDKDLINGSYRLEIRGNDGGVWTINLSDQLQVTSGKKNADIVLMMMCDDFLSIANGKINPQIALASRRIKINGDPRKASLIQNILAPRPI